MKTYRQTSLEEVKRAFRSQYVGEGDDEPDISSAREAIINRHKKKYAAYDGGEGMLSYSNPKLDTVEQREALKKLFHNLRVVPVIVNTHAGLLYSQPPMRRYWFGEKPTETVYDQAQEIFNAMVSARDAGQEFVPPKEAPNESQSRQFAEWDKQTLVNNSAPSLFSALAVDFILSGCGILKVFNELGPDGKAKMLRYVQMQPWDVLRVLDPKKSTTIIADIECGHQTTREGKAVDIFRVWMSDKWVWVDSEFDPVPEISEEEREHKLGRTPFVFFGEGPNSTYLDDAVTDQVHANQIHQAYDWIKRLQGFSIPYAEGEPLNNGWQSKDGKTVLRVGPSEMLMFQQGGSVAFASPDAPLEEHRQGIKEHLERTMKAYNVPDDFVRASTGTEKPLAMLFRWIPTILQRDAFLCGATDFEHDRAALAQRYAEMFWSTYGLGATFPDEKFTYSVEFPENPLPQDRAEMERSDRERVEAGLMTLCEYVYRRHPEWNAEHIARHAFHLYTERQRASRGQTETQTPEAPEGQGRLRAVGVDT